MLYVFSFFHFFIFHRSVTVGRRLELEILEAYQSADEYLNMESDSSEFYFESEE